MSRIVYVTPPAHGHLNPVLPVLRELVARGEDVACFNTEEFRESIERTGAAFVPYPATELSSDRISEVLQNGNLANSTDLLLRGAEQLLPFTLSELAAAQPDVVVFDSIALWGRMAATRLGLRTVGSITHLLVDWGQIPLADQLRLLRQYLPKLSGILRARRRLIQAYGRAYPPTMPVIPVHGDVNVVFTIPALQPKTRIIDETFHFVGPSINPQTRSECVSTHSVGPDPVVYISLGTVHSRDPAFFRACFEAFGNFPRRFVLSIGRHVRIDELGTIPANFIVQPSVAQLDILQRADVFITHGGINSVLEGLYYGVPLVLIPHQFEQLVNARCVAGRGAGLIVESRMRRKPVTARELRTALDAILDDTRYRTSARNLQASLQERGGYREAASLIQLCATGPKPDPVP
jgi:MGT family glycosyltransferase